LKGIGDNITRMSIMGNQKLLAEKPHKGVWSQFKHRPASIKLVMERIDYRWRMIKREQLGLEEDSFVVEEDEYSDDEDELEWNISSGRNHEWRDAEVQDESEYEELIWKRGLGEDFDEIDKERPMPALIKEMAARSLNNEPPHHLTITTLASKAHIEFKIIGGGTSEDGDLVWMVNTHLSRLKILVMVKEIFNVPKQDKRIIRPLVVELTGRKTWYEEGYYSASGRFGIGE